MKKLMNYLNSKKENIKTGAKKAVATGLVVSTLLGGAAMATGCEDANLTSEEKEYNQVLKDIDKQFKGKYSAVTICKDEITDKNIIVFAGDECQKGATFEISEEEFNRIKAAAISAQNENISLLSKR